MDNFKKFQFEIFFILLVSILLYIPAVPQYSTKCFTKNELNNTSLISSTNILITNVQLEYHILPTGKYNCFFSVESLGNNLTESGLGKCRISILNPPVEELTITIAGENASYSTDEENNSFNVLFLLDPIPCNYKFFITGNFIGTFTDNAFGVYIYELGIDWGTIVTGVQSTVIRFDDYYTILSNEAQFLETNFGEFLLSWNESSVTGFNTRLELQPKSVSTNIIQVSFTAWNATAGENKIVSIQNIANFNITAWIMPPSWILASVSKFILSPNQQIVVELTVNRDIPIGTNGTISIVSTQFDQINILVRVTATATTPFPLIQTISIVSIAFILGVMVYKKDEISQFSRKYKEVLFKNVSDSEILNEDDSLLNNGISEIISEEKETTWHSIQTKWEPILPEKELQVLSILFFQGSKNQKNIAQEIGVSKMTMSRILTRLESKRLIVRVRTGMSNMIKLKEDHIF